MSNMSSIGSAVLDLSTQKVIGWTRSKIKHNKKSDVTSSISVGVQAWEIGILVAAAGAYYYLTGNHIQDAVINSMNTVNPGNPANGLGLITTMPLPPLETI